MNGVTSVTFRQLDINEIIDLCKRAELECIEWGGDVHVPQGDIKKALETAMATKEAGLIVSSYGSYFRVGVNEIADFNDVLLTAEALEAPVIRVWCGNIPSDKTDNALFLKYIKDLQMICDMAKEKNIAVACEYHNHTFNDTPNTALKLINAVDRENFKTYWQTVAYDKDDLRALKMLKGHIAVAHIFTWNKRAVRFDLERKYKMWENYFAEMKGEGINYIMEFVKNDSPAQFLKDAETLKRLVG